MNLKDILDYRNECIHCGRQLVMHVSKHPKLLIEREETGLLIKSKNPNGLFLRFKFDGSYERSKREYEIHKKPIFIKKYCHWHMLHTNTNVGMSINDCKDITCYYDFTIFGDSQGNYDASMSHEFIAYHNEEELWHVNTFHSAGKTHLYHGYFYEKIEDMLSLTLPIMNLSGAKTQQQYLDKVKLYTLFS